uniref:Generative cell specific-1/HAP2 domain-containing protein n=1 Tax=Auxenochlorella protothecoides TaxID=3075 RepID=A0A1D2A410_AUXPR
MRRWRTRWWVAVFLCIAPRCSWGTVISSGTLTSCVSNGSTDSTELSCSKKILVTLTLANNKLYASDELQFTLSCVNSATGVCPCPCDYATDATCTCRDLARNMTISMTKGAVYALYPLTFSRRYQGAPTETIVTTTVENCNDEYGAVAPTCGWATLNGVNVLDSQGFCCECTLVNGYWTNYMRGSLYCPAAAGKSPSQYLASAHCLRFNDDWWFVGYVVGNYQMDFNIAFNVTTTKTGGTNATSETLTVNPSVPIVRSADKTVTASLLGDLASYSQIPNLANHYLMVILDSLSDTPSVAFSKNKETWMLLDPALVDPAGLTCDKVGITYSGFRVNLADKCNIPNGYCLRNQLVDLYYADVERINAGHDPLYFVTKYSGGVQNERQMTYSLSSSGKTTFVLNLPVPSLTQSLVTLAVSADSVQFVSNTSPAKIQSTQLCTLYDVQCGTFESLEGSGYLTVTLENTGTLTADYYVSLTSCSDNVVKALAQYATIKAGAKYNFVFTITMATDQATSSTCSVEVRDSQGDLLDSTAVTWATLGTDYGQEPQEGTASPPYYDDSTIATSFSGCNKVCGTVLSLKCLVKYSCWYNLAAGLGSASAAGLAIIALIWAAKQGYIVPILGMVLRLLCCSGPSSHRSKAKKVAPAQPPSPPKADATVTLDAGAASKTSLPPAGPTAAADSGALLGTGPPPPGFKRLSSLRKSWLWPGRFMPGGAGPPVMPTDSMYDQASLPHHPQSIPAPWAPSSETGVPQYGPLGSSHVVALAGYDPSQAHHSFPQAGILHSGAPFSSPVALGAHYSTPSTPWQHQAAEVGSPPSLVMGMPTVKAGAPQGWHLPPPPQSSHAQDWNGAAGGATQMRWGTGEPWVPQQASPEQSSQPGCHRPWESPPAQTARWSHQPTSQQSMPAPHPNPSHGSQWG